MHICNNYYWLVFVIIPYTYISLAPRISYSPRTASTPILQYIDSAFTIQPLFLINKSKYNSYSNKYILYDMMFFLISDYSELGLPFFWYKTTRDSSVSG